MEKGYYDMGRMKTGFRSLSAVVGLIDRLRGPGKESEI